MVRSGDYYLFETDSEEEEEEKEEELPQKSAFQVRVSITCDKGLKVLRDPKPTTVGHHGQNSTYRQRKGCFASRSI